jgi:predicted cupin superfamily sugar epimerase
MPTADRIIALLGLAPLPEEGGYYAETYRLFGPGASATETPTDSRPLATAIFYLVTLDAFSALHRLPSDELFHFYLGDPVEQLRLRPDGSGQVVTLGIDLEAGQRPQVVVPGGVWQGARLAPGGVHGFALLGTTMTPGFDAATYEGGDRTALTAAYPAFAARIAALTR